MEKDEFTAWFDQEEFLWSEEESDVGFMKCHVQKRFQSDVYVNCKPVHRSKCLPVYQSTILRFLKNVSLK